MSPFDITSRGTSLKAQPTINLKKIYEFRNSHEVTWRAERVPYFHKLKINISLHYIFMTFFVAAIIYCVCFCCELRRINTCGDDWNWCEFKWEFESCSKTVSIKIAFILREILLWKCDITHEPSQNIRNKLSFQLRNFVFDLRQF